MRITPVLTLASLIIACGPPPENDPIYGYGGSVSRPTGGTTSATGGIQGGTGGTVVATGGSTNPFGGNTPTTGGTSTGGTGGAPRTGGLIIVGTGGTSSGGNGGATSLTSYNFAEGEEPCTNPKDVSLKTPDLGTGASCYRTADDIQGWGASNFEGKTLKVNRVAVTLPTTGGAPTALPPKLGSFYYFDISEGGVAWASLYWYGTARPVPACGSFPAWKSGATGVAACEAH